MRFIVLDEGERPRHGRRRRQACLLEPVPGGKDEYLTLYKLWFSGSNGQVVELGLVKIGYSDLVRRQRPLQKGSSFSWLGWTDTCTGSRWGRMRPTTRTSPGSMSRCRWRSLKVCATSRSALPLSEAPCSGT